VLRRCLCDALLRNSAPIRLHRENNLQERLTALGKLVVLPVALLDALQDVRLLGNDAAHIEAKTYDDIGNAEVEAGISVARLVLSNLFQTELVVERLRALKK